MAKIIEVKKLCKAFGDQQVFEDFYAEVEENEFVAIAGKSGSGKSTLLNMIGLLDKQSSGDIILFGEKNIKPFSKRAEKMLKHHIGYLFQNFALVENESVYYNMMLAIENQKIKDKKTKIAEALKAVGLEGYENKKVYKCSGGEQQRISIARLLIKPCDLVLADEPTGSLDHENKMQIFYLLKELQNKGKTLIVVTHDRELVEIADRVIYL
ncbi:ATP-binding cassette domain-containing protein [Massilicoli timonensis]|uniref:ATP-binding cassette domain-containing protein n=1 Tax=Massilicoli timonensis TaxID=2015901 RepID=A0ABT1SIE8_9FIRM|nr:ATP-binding cassette domain-containing protein [Massilicoli timonensis]MCQ5120965.1 ATP-binding cassette domain-containing protein [Massilicoli timonensis]